MSELEPTITELEPTATERLRALLDERGVEWWPMHDVENGYQEDRDTEFLVDGCKHVAHEWGRGLQVDMLTPEQAVEATLGSREQPPYDELIESLRRDWDIEASWDGLRRFWSIGLTEDGCLMRDRACKAEDENAKLRELVRDAWGDGHPDRSCEGCDIRDECHDDVERMRKDGVLRFSRCLFELRIEERMRELGIEV